MRTTHEPRVVIATDGVNRYRDRTDAIVVRTPLDLIQALANVATISTAILSDQFARVKEVAAFLREAYPDLRLLTVLEPTVETN